MIKKVLVAVTIFLLGNVSGQVRIVNNAINLSTTNSPAFLDASSNTTVNLSNNIGKGLIFPRVDLSTLTSFPSVIVGIPNSFPTRFDGMIVYNTANSGTAGVGATLGTLTSGFWYYDNKSSTNTGGIWKSLTSSISSGDNLGNHSATQNIGLNLYELRLKDVNDNENSLVYNTLVNGPRLIGGKGGYLGTANGNNALQWDSYGKVTIPTNNGRLRFSSPSNNRNITFYEDADNEQQFYGFGINASALRYQISSLSGAHIFYAATSATSSDELFRINGYGNVTSRGYIQSGIGSIGFIRLIQGDTNHTGHLGIYKVDGTRLGYIGYNNSNLTYVTENGADHVFSGGDLYTDNEVYSGIGKWFRIRGANTGVRWEDYDSGFYMNENSTIKIYNNKALFTTGNGSFGDVRAGAPGIGYARLSPGGISNSGHLQILKSNGSRIGYIGYDNTNMYYAAEGGAVHLFNTTIVAPRIQGPSDRRFKKNIELIDQPTVRLQQLNGYTYSWKDKKEFPDQTLGQGKDIGVIAQEVEKVLPDAVITNKEGYKSVNYNALIPLLIEALKESNERIRVLEARMDVSAAPQAVNIPAKSSGNLSNKQAVVPPAEANKMHKGLYDGPSPEKK
ncbi:tail fiber domain-containing protein [Epilithonimonas sp. JDS]|uniref:tail fiber domain-containing protein n=1 Tax=Epilithonimonas sp. JDS TaxID=2902797 RepID=UPI001E336334|nr:tail fiber domain-containing protein [Epilithonimonas sp. JDS]MCD9855155.1 tail fiber domain-containing protein [Epilithonimonas sp. JDS]